MRFGSCESCTTWWIQHKLFVNDRPQLIQRTSKRYRMHRKLVWNSHTQCTPDSHNMHAHKHNHACPYFISLCQFHQSLHRGYVSIDGLITAYEKHASTLHWPWHAHPQWNAIKKLKLPHPAQVWDQRHGVNHMSSHPHATPAVAPMDWACTIV